MFRKFIAAAILAVTATGAMAEPMRMYCNIKKPNGWIADQLYFDIDASGKATVVDPIVLHFEGGPVEAKVRENSNKKLTLTWTVVTKNNRGQITRMAYRAALLKGNNRLTMSAKPHGYSNSFSGRGACQRTTNPLPST